MARGKVGDKLHYCISPVIDFLMSNSSRFVPGTRKGGSYAKLYQWIPGFEAFYSSLNSQQRKEYERITILRNGFNADAYDHADEYYYVEDNQENCEKIKGYFEAYIWEECSTRAEYNEQAEKCLEHVKSKYYELKESNIATAKAFFCKTNGVLNKIFENISAENFYKLILYCQYHEDSTAVPLTKEVHNEHSTKENNVYVSTKAEIEAYFPIEERLHGAKKIILCNFAGSSFLLGKGISTDYKEKWGLTLFGLIAEGCNVTMVLTNPDSFAAYDAEEYKMRAMRIREKTILSSNDFKGVLRKLIRSNIRYLNVLKTSSMPDLNKRFQLRLTDVALPCAYFLCEFDDTRRNHIKIDIYTPNSTKYSQPKRDGGENVYELIKPERYDGNARISFIVWQKSPNSSQSTEKLYCNIRESILDIVENMSRLCLPEEWDKIGHEKEDNDKYQ